MYETFSRYITRQLILSCSLLLLTTVVIHPSVSIADEITDSIDEALTFYKQGDHSGAVGSLNYAVQLIGQKKGGRLEALLPQPLTGWTADEASSQAMNAAFLGGGVSAERHYRKAPAPDSDGQESSLTVKIITDSTVLQGILMMFNNPMFATADGGKLEKINGEKAIVKYNATDRNGSINIVVANTILVTIEGDSVTSADLKAYASAVDYRKLAALR